MTRVTEGTEGPQREDPKENRVPLVYQVTLDDQLMAKMAVTERGDLAVLPVSPVFPGLRVPPA